MAIDFAQYGSSPKPTTPAYTRFLEADVLDFLKDKLGGMIALAPAALLFSSGLPTGNIETAKF
jgi:hypothetical protein